MIRIDLGKSELDKGAAPGKSFIDPRITEKLRASGINLDLTTMVLFGVVAAFAGLPYLFVSQYRAYAVAQIELQVRTLSEKEETLKQDIQKMSLYKSELDSYEKQKQKIRERLEIVKRLLTARGTPVNILDAISQALPKRVWLEAMDYSSEKSTINLSGTALANEDISDFVDHLSESIHLSEVELEQVSTKEVGNTDFKAFSVAAIPKGITNTVKMGPLPGTPPGGRN